MLPVHERRQEDWAPFSWVGWGLKVLVLGHRDFNEAKSIDCFLYDGNIRR